MLEKKFSNELKILGLEAINNAKSGHSGSVLSLGDALFTLYTKHLVADETNSMLRDRLVLSNGHACAGLYAVLSALGYFNEKELKNFRQFNGLLTGHPEVEIPGIDCSTGPLGQGVANAVGMAIAETILNAKFGLSHYTYCVCGDGCLQEGVAQEALSVAGLYNLNKFILLYDKNNVTLDGGLQQSSIDNVGMKFKAMNFNVICCDGHNITKIDKAISKAKASKKPTVIILNTVIGKDTELANSHLSHGKVYSCEDIEKLKKLYNIDNEKLSLSSEVKEYFKSIKQSIVSELKDREEQFEKQLKENGKEKEYKKWLSADAKFKIKSRKEDNSTRAANGLVLNNICKTVDNFVALSADLSSSTKVKIDGEPYSVKNRLGKTISVGIREHAMGAIANGIALHGGLFVTTSTFLTFSNYMLPAVRMASIMKLPVLFTFTHSSVYETPDGVTHLPVEQLDQLRLIPGITVFRPCNINECEAVYDYYFETKMPVCVCLSRGTIPYYNKNVNINKGAYLLSNSSAQIHIMASGSEVRIANKVKDLLSSVVKAEVVSVPSLEVFENQPKTYKNKILNKPIFVIESGTCVKYLKYTSVENLFNVDKFGSTGNENQLMEKYGFDEYKIAQKIIKIINKK